MAIDEGYDVLEDEEHLSLWDDEIEAWEVEQLSPRARFVIYLLLTAAVAIGTSVVAALMFAVALVTFVGGAVLAVSVG